MNTLEFLKERTKRGRGGLIVGLNGREPAWPKLYMDCLPYMGATPMTLDQFKAEAELAHPRNTPEDFEFEYPTVETAEDFIEQVFQVNKYAVSPLGQTLKSHGYSVTLDDLNSHIAQHVDRYERDSIRPVDGKRVQVRHVWSPSRIQQIVPAYLRQFEQVCRDKLKADMVFKPDLEEKTLNILRYLLGQFKCKGDIELAAQMFRQWLWQTKRYILGEPVHDPIFLNIYSEGQHIGKTFLVKHLMQPLRDFFMVSELFTDERKNELWTKMYCLFFDELAIQDTVDNKSRMSMMATLKQILTSSEVSLRTMRTTKHTTATRTASPISTSNFPLVKALYDPSGMRRFFEIELAASVTDHNHLSRLKDLESLDPWLLWGGVDAQGREKGYVFPGAGEMYDRLRENQMAMKHREIIDEVLEFGGDDCRIPVRIENISRDIIAKISETDMKISTANAILKEHNLEAVRLGDVRKEFYDWIDGNDGHQIAQWLPQSENFYRAMLSRGFAVLPTLAIVKVRGKFGGMNG